MLSGSQMARLLDYRQRQQEEHQQRLRERLQEALQQSSSQVFRCLPFLITSHVLFDLQECMVSDQDEARVLFL